MKILIVDDGAVNRRLLRAVLEGEKIEVVEAGDGIEALAGLSRQPCDLIISDILMPRMDGYRLCKEVRDDKRWREIPFIFYTATYVSPGDEKLCYDLGGDKYLRKPASRKDLLAAICGATQAMDSRAPRRAGLLSETDVMREYSQRLVSKLEEKNEQLERAKADLEKANEELEDRVRQRTAELRLANEELESFSFSVSHDLRSPLNHIRGYIEILVRDCGWKLDGSDKKHLQAVHAAARRMDELIDTLLELSHLTRAEMNPRPVNLSAMASEIVTELRQREPKREVTMEIAPDVQANGDARLLRVALGNLFDNAWKYTRKKPEARIEFGRIGARDADIHFVRDNGAGFDMAYSRKLFGAFQRLHSPQEFEGHGIGLATVQRIIQRHHGRVWGESVIHKGATFYFTLNETENAGNRLPAIQFDQNLLGL